MLEEFQLEQIVKPLLAWFEKNARTLPWRSISTPYRVWVSGDHAAADPCGGSETIF